MNTTLFNWEAIVAVTGFYYYLDEITLSSAVAGGDNLGFIMTNLSY